MKKPAALPPAKNAILTLSEIKTATEAFDRGETNVLDALDTIVAAVEAYQAAANEGSKQCQRKRRAA